MTSAFVFVSMSCVVTVIVPAVEPLWNVIGTVVPGPPAAIGNGADVVLLFGKTTVASPTVSGVDPGSASPTEFGGAGVKVSVEVAVIGSGKGLTVKLMVGLCPVVVVEGADTVAWTGGRVTMIVCMTWAVA